MEAATAYDAVSLDSPAYGSQAEAEATLLDVLGADEEGYRHVEYAVTIERALRALPVRQRVILGLRFREDMTQAEIATRLGMSQMHVSRLLRQALARLREVARVRQQGQGPPGGPIMAA
jgi:RNA polymerase sigma-B factor